MHNILPYQTVILGSRRSSRKPSLQYLFFPTPALWAPEEGAKCTHTSRNTPNDSVFHHISKKSKGLPETSFGAAPPSYSGIEPPHGAPPKPPAVPFARREPKKRPNQSQSFTPTSWPAQMQPGTLKDNVQWKVTSAIGSGVSGPSQAQSCVSDVSPMMRNGGGTSFECQFEKERVNEPSSYVPPPFSRSYVQGAQIGRQDGQNRGQGWNANVGMYSVRPTNTSSYPRPSKRVWPGTGMYTAQNDRDEDEEYRGGAQGGYVPPEEKQRIGSRDFVQSTWKPTTASRYFSNLSKETKSSQWSQRWSLLLFTFFQ